MDNNLNFKSNKGFRLLNMYERLNKGEVLKKNELANDFGVSPKTIQRDIADLRIYLAEKYISEINTTIKYDKTIDGYYLVRVEREWLTNKEVLALSKIVLESRAFNKRELERLIAKLVIQVVPEDRAKVESMIRNELHHYVPVRHGKNLLSTLWDLSQFIMDRELIQFTYVRQDGAVKKRVVKPVSILFSEYYFYLIAYLEEKDDFPAIFRIDRISEIKGLKQSFKIPYKNKFNDGEFRKRIQFMYPGQLTRIVFNFSGPSIEAVLDRLPTAQIIEEKDGVYTIEAEVYGKGIEMWLKSQGDHLSILSPTPFRAAFKESIRRMLDLYENT